MLKTYNTVIESEVIDVLREWANNNDLSLAQTIRKAMKEFIVNNNIRLTGSSDGGRGYQSIIDTMGKNK